MVAEFHTEGLVVLGSSKPMGLITTAGDHWPGTPCLTAMGSSTSEPAEETGLCGVQSPKVAKVIGSLDPC